MRQKLTYFPWGNIYLLPELRSFRAKGCVPRSIYKKKILYSLSYLRKIQKNLWLGKQTNKQSRTKESFCSWLKASPVLRVSWNMLKRVLKAASCGLPPPAWHEQGDYKGTHVRWSLLSAQDTNGKVWAREGRRTVAGVSALKKPDTLCSANTFPEECGLTSTLHTVRSNTVDLPGGWRQPERNLKKCFHSSVFMWPDSHSQFSYILTWKMQPSFASLHLTYLDSCCGYLSPPLLPPPWSLCPVSLATDQQSLSRCLHMHLLHFPQ